MTLFGKIIFGALTLTIVGGLVYGLSSYMNKDVAIEQTPEIVKEDVVATSTSTSKKVPFSTFIKQGGAYTCSVTQTVENITSKGTVYVSGENIRAEFSTTIGGQTIGTTMVTKDGYTYTWNDMSPKIGYKTKNVKVEVEATTTPPASEYSFDGAQIGDYSCEEGALDAAKFAVPTTITFTEMK